ncbi:MAG: hypothetical protein JO307_17295 [Bryobacterales bacterium]|nr:hypothetical protein [Bryobacterales bacterium]MBV9400265.1 hypothetical protein [Bryobacterales bacterium]
MGRITDYPLLVFALSVVVLWIAELVGVSLRRKPEGPEKDEREDLGMLLAGALTLLGVIIGFTFSMAVGRYDRREAAEEAESVAIKAELLKADLLLAESDARKVRGLLRSYLDQRIMFYTARDANQRQNIDATTAQIESELWSAIRAPNPMQLPPLVVVPVSGMTDVFNAETSTRAAWLSRIPAAAWILMLAIAVCCNALIGYSTHNAQANAKFFPLILPLIVAIAFFLIADIDSPRSGVIRVHPQNLEALSLSWR